MKVCKCHGYAADWDEAAEVAHRTKRNVQVCPTPQKFAVAMDAASTNTNEDFSPEVKAKIARAKRKVALDAEKDALAELRVGLLMPSLRAMVMDDMESEQAAQGSFSSEEDESELERGEVSGNSGKDEDNTFGASYAASLKATNDYWDKVKRVKPSATYERVRGRSNKPTAVDHVGRNAKKARSFTLFDSAKTVINKLKGV